LDLENSELKYISSDSELDQAYVYTLRNNLLIDGNDEIIKNINLEKEELSSTSSSRIPPKKVSRKNQKLNNRENNAKRFLTHLEKVKTKVVKKKLNLEDSHSQIRPMRRFIDLEKDSQLELDGTSLKSLSSIKTCSDTKNQNLKKKNKIIGEKFEKDNKIRELILRKDSKNNKNSRSCGLKMHYSDLNRKENFVFFE